MIRDGTCRMFELGVTVHCEGCRADAGQNGFPLECPHGHGTSGFRLGTLIERAVKPVAKLLGLSCLEKDGRLRAGSPCAKRRDALNRIGRSN